MKRPPDPSRLSSEVPRGSALGRALEAAQRRGPTSEQLRALDGSVFAAITPDAAASPSTREAPRAPTSTGIPTSTLKLVALLALASIGTGAGVRWIRRPPAPVAAAATVDLAAAVQASSGRSAPPAETAAAPDLGDATTLEPKTPRLAPRRSSGPRRPAQAFNATSQNELDLLERADRALATAPAVALSLAESHERLFPASSMEEEREVIAISALARLGRDREASSRADRFTHGHTSSAYAVRIQRALAQKGQAIEVPR